MQITAFTYPNGWNFRGDWHWNSPFTIQGDFNGDGKGDFARMGAGYMHMFISKGSGSFYSPIYRYPDGWSFGLDPNEWTASVLDISGDCRQDIVRNSVSLSRALIAQGTDSNCWFKDGWIGQECFSTKQFMFPSAWSFDGSWLWNSHAFIRTDFNGDGRHDFARLGNTEVRFFISKGDGRYYTPTYKFPAGWDFTFDENIWSSVPPGDFDGDGKFDIIRTSGTYNHGLMMRGSNLNCWYTDGVMNSNCILLTTFHYPNGWNFIGYWTWNSLATKVGDFNGDSRDDYINLRGGRYHHAFYAK